MDEGQSSYIKFGGYDDQAMFPPGELIMMKSLSPKSFKLGFQSMQIGGQTFFDILELVNLNKEKNRITRYVQFNPAFPFIYLPKEDFNRFA